VRTGGTTGAGVGGWATGAGVGVGPGCGVVDGDAPLGRIMIRPGGSGVDDAGLGGSPGRFGVMMIVGGSAAPVPAGGCAALTPTTLTNTSGVIQFRTTSPPEHNPHNPLFWGSLSPKRRNPRAHRQTAEVSRREPNCLFDQRNRSGSEFRGIDDRPKSPGSPGLPPWAENGRRSSAQNRAHRGRRPLVHSPGWGIGSQSRAETLDTPAPTDEADRLHPIRPHTTHPLPDYPNFHDNRLGSLCPAGPTISLALGLTSPRFRITPAERQFRANRTPGLRRIPSARTPATRTGTMFVCPGF